MKTTKFQDLSNNQIQVSLSGGGDYRVYCMDGEDIKSCLLLNKPQALILINAIQDLIDSEEK